jgi:FMN phosphatase YigB (HAD superfamily)
MRFRAVLFDWRGTLATTLDETGWVREAMHRLGRAEPEARVSATADLLRTVEAELDAPGTDSDPALHRRTYLRVLGGLGLDDELVTALYEVESDPTLNRFAADVPVTFTALRRAGVRVGVVSDVHVDIRPAFADAGIAADVFALSFEQGTQKPDGVMFLTALSALGVEPGEALFVGDRPGPDGGAVEHGLTTLLLPTLTGVDDCRLDLVAALCGSESGAISHAR